MSNPSGIRVLVVDDSAVVRQSLRTLLGRDRAIGLVETAVNGEVALQKIQRLDPDVITLDVEMPVLDGLATLEKIMKLSPRPVIMLSGHTFEGADKTLRALELGAADFIQKPGGNLAGSPEAIARALLAKIKAVAGKRRRPPAATVARAHAAKPRVEAVRPPRPASRSIGGKRVSVVAIGASTGGTEALRALLTQLPADFPAAVLVVQHMPEGFTRAFARRLDEQCAIAVKEASHRDLVVPGRALVAAGNHHLVAHSEAGLAFVELSRRPKESGHRPSVDVLFRSVAACFRERALAVLLTGMGRDGAAGMAEVDGVGGATIAQDEASSVVYGMPRAAVESGAAQVVASLRDIPTLVRRIATG